MMLIVLFFVLLSFLFRAFLPNPSFFEFFDSFVCVSGPYGIFVLNLCVDSFRIPKLFCPEHFCPILHFAIVFVLFVFLVSLFEPGLSAQTGSILDAGVEC